MFQQGHMILRFWLVVHTGMTDSSGTVPAIGCAISGQPYIWFLSILVHFLARSWPLRQCRQRGGKRLFGYGCRIRMEGWGMKAEGFAICARIRQGALALGRDTRQHDLYDISRVALGINRQAGR